MPLPSSREADRDQRRDGGRRRADRAPSSAGQQRDRNQDAELRLVGQQADQHAREPWPAIEPVQRAAEQRRGEKSVLAVADIDEHRREGGGDQQRFLARQDRADRGEVGGKARDQPDRQAPGVGNGGDENGDREEERRIVPAVERHLAAVEHRLLGGMLERGRVGLGGAALPGQCACGIDVGKIGADRLAVAVDQAVGSRDPAGEHQDRRGRAGSGCSRACAPPSAIRRIAASRSLARNESFRRGIFANIAPMLDRTEPALTFPKVWALSGQASCDAACRALGCLDPIRKKSWIGASMFTTFARR